MSPLMHRSCTEFNYLLTYSPPVEVRSAEKKKWSGVGCVCVPRLLRFRAAGREAQQFLFPPSFFCLPAVEGGGRKREQESTDIVITCKFSILFLRGGGGGGSSSRLPRTSHFFLSLLLCCFVLFYRCFPVSCFPFSKDCYYYYLLFSNSAAGGRQAVNNKQGYRRSAVVRVSRKKPS